MNLTLIINATALSLSTLAAVGLFAAAFRWRDTTTGGQVLFMTIWGIAGLLVAAFFSNLVFDTNRFVAFLPTFFVPFVTVGMLLIPMTVPNRSFRWIHWLVLGSIIPLLCASLIPGVGYEDFVPTPNGYTDLVPGPYFVHLQIISGGLGIAAIATYVYRMYRERRGPVRNLLRNLFLGHIAETFIVIASAMTLPALGYSEFLTVGVSLGFVLMMIAITYAYTRYREETREAA